MKTFLGKHQLLIVLILVAAFARFYNLGKFYYFMMDEERDFFIASNILKGKLTLIGGSVPGGIFLGPLYFYFTSVLLFLFRLQPLGMAVFASLLGVVETVMLFKTTKLFIKETKICFYISLLYAASFLIVIYNRTYWPLTFAPLVTILTWNFLYRVVAHKNEKYIIPLAVVQLVGLQTDPSNISSFIIAILAFIIFKIFQKYRLKVAAAIIIIILAHLPLLIFDLRHNFYISRNVLSFFSMKKNVVTKKTKQTPERFNQLNGTVDLIFNTFSRTVYVNKNYDVAHQITIAPQWLKARDQNIVGMIKWLCILCLFIFLYKAWKTKNLGLRIVAGQFLMIIIGIGIYSFLFPGYLHEWFLNVFWPGFVVIFIYALVSVWKNRYYQMAISLAIFLIMAMNLRVLSSADNSLGYHYKEEAVNYIKTKCFKNPCSIDGSLSWSGFEYLLRLKGIIPQTSATDQANNGWLYQKPKLSFADTIVVVMSPDEIVLKDQTPIIKSYLQHEIERKQFQGYLVLVADNSSHWR